jgi:alkanesulfonate monooxygenase SsuD/methylene tetrahydromethanopterin reductase-like flavin-dependent oxidoreductase (luciferase family)
VEQPPVEFGLYLPQVALSPEEILDRARAAERYGFDSLWFYDHLYSPGRPDLPSYEAWTLATWVLAHTARLRVGHLVLCNTFRHPALLAKMVATLALLSDDRFELGLGSGSVEVEHRQAGLAWGPAAERAERLGEALSVLEAMFAGGPATFDGRHYQLDDMPNLPLPSRRPPVHVGGTGPRRTLPLVARHADVWNVPTYGLKNWEESRRQLDAECETIGRDPATLRTSHEAVLVIAPDEGSLTEARATADRRYGAPGFGLDDGGYIGTPPVVAAHIAGMVARGVSHFVFLTHDRADPATLELFAERVIPELR